MDGAASAGPFAAGAWLCPDDGSPDVGHALRFNSGMTKVYSLLLDHFVIDDSRVAGAAQGDGLAQPGPGLAAGPLLVCLISGISPFFP